MDSATSASVAGVARAVLALGPLADALGHPLPVPSASTEASRALSADERTAAWTVLVRVARGLGPTRFAASQTPWIPPIFERVVGRLISFDACHRIATRVPEDRLHALGSIVGDVRAESFEETCHRTRVRTADGASLRVYGLGDRRHRSIVVCAPCGMPAALFEPWMRALAEDWYAITWETRGLFDHAEGFDGLSLDAAAQADDLIAVMDALGIDRAHVMGLCDGAVVALLAAAERRDRLSSLSLWYGDFALGPDCPRTNHQVDMQALMEAASEDRASAASVQAMLCEAMLTSELPDQAHYALYPYANAELLYRFSRLSAGLMRTDVRPLLGRVVQPTLVVTCEGDQRTHPEGSKQVAAGLFEPTLELESSEGHQALFHARPDATELVARFLSRVTPDA